mgnify:CR=1 FL=1
MLSRDGGSDQRAFAGKPWGLQFYRTAPGAAGSSAAHSFQWPQAERARRSELSQPPPMQRPVTVSAATMTVSGVAPGWRSPCQRSQLAQRLRSTA